MDADTYVWYSDVGDAFPDYSVGSVLDETDASHGAVRKVLFPSYAGMGRRLSLFRKRKFD